MRLQLLLLLAAILLGSPSPFRGADPPCGVLPDALRAMAPEAAQNPAPRRIRAHRTAGGQVCWFRRDFEILCVNRLYPGSPHEQSHRLGFTALPGGGPFVLSGLSPAGSSRRLDLSFGGPHARDVHPAARPAENL